MDKKQSGCGMKKYGMAFLVLVVLLLVSGCETAKGAYYGAKEDMKSLAQMDTWLRDNLW